MVSPDPYRGNDAQEKASHQLETAPRLNQRAMEVDRHPHCSGVRGIVGIATSERGPCSQSLPWPADCQRMSHNVSPALLERRRATQP